MLFLTSQASNTLHLLLPLLNRAPENLSVAFIPTAGDLYMEKPWMEADRNKLIDLGFRVYDVDIKEFSKEQLRQKLSTADIIFVAGGTTTYLLEKVKQSGFDQIVKELVKTGVIYIGSSAGSVLAGPNVEVDRMYDHRGLGRELDSYEGLGLVDFIVLPHADNKKYESVIQQIVKKFGKKYTLQKLNDNQAILVKDNKYQVIDA